jgi:predicted dehydrogenase
MTLRLGILGAGGIAETFTADILGAGHQGHDLDVVAVGSRDQAKSDGFARRFEIERAYGDYEALVQDPAVDAVYIATPHVFHREQALLAIAAGKHVLVEKPFTVNAAEAREVFGAAAAAGVIALDAMWTRFLPQTARLREILRAGTIGEPRLFVGTHAQSLPTDPRHRINDPALGGGALLDLGVYPVAFALDVLGAPIAISAQARLSEQGVDRSIASAMTHTGSGEHGTAQSILFSALDVASDNTGLIQGTEGRIQLAGPFFTPQGFTVHGPDGSVVERYEPDEKGLRGMHHQALELARLIDEGWSDDTALTPAATIAVMETMDEMRRQVGVRYPSDG